MSERAHDVWLPPQRIVHRDLKAENVLVGSDGHVKLCDFGLAHMHESDDDDRLKGVFGTWLYQVRRLRFFLLDGARGATSHQILRVCLVGRAPSASQARRTPDVLQTCMQWASSYSAWPLGACPTPARHSGKCRKR